MDVEPTGFVAGRWRRHRRRSVAFGQVGADLAGVVAEHGGQAERVYVIGQAPGGAAGPGAYAYGAALPEGWRHDGHLLDGRRPVYKLVGPWVDGRQVRLEVARAESWTGEDHAYGAGELRQAWARVDGLLRGAFGQGAGLMGSPATTGRDLMLRAFPDGSRWGVLPVETQDLIRGSSGQARVEGCWHWPAWPGHRRYGDGLPAVVASDMRLAYGALCRELPAVPAGEVVTHDDRSEVDPYQRGRYRVTWTVPAGWDHLGILPAPAEGDASRRWWWPAEPGQSGAGWVDGAELLIARRHGWTVDVRERLLFPRYRGRGPLDGWADRLLRIYGQVGGAAGAMIRAIIVQGIGALVGARSRVTFHDVWPGAQIPAGAVDVRVAGERVTWTVERPAAWPELCHPEWAAAVWARCRARLLDGPQGTGVLQLPWSSIIAVSTDAAYLTAAPGWPDDGAPGRWRTKGRRPGPVPVPASREQLLGLRP